jgi:DNA repair protein RadA/Sms
MDVVIPASFYDRLKSGMDELDAALSPDYPGFTRGSINLLTGQPGSGKSTCTLAIATHIARHYGPVLYNSGEQSVYALRHIMARTGLVPPPALVFANMTETSAIIDTATHLKVAAIVQDSIQCLGDSHAANERATKVIIDWAMRTGVTALLIGQVNKDGEASGRNSIRHLSDAHLEFQVGKREEKSAALVRRMTISKNRNGACSVLQFKLDATGIHFVAEESQEARWGWTDEPPPEEPPPPTPAAPSVAVDSPAPTLAERAMAIAVASATTS